MTKKQKTLSDWDWTTLVAAWRYYEHGHTITSVAVGNAAAMREIVELRKGISELLDALQAIYDEECTSYGTGEVYAKWRKALKGDKE